MAKKKQKSVMPAFGEGTLNARFVSLVRKGKLTASKAIKVLHLDVRGKDAYSAGDWAPNAGIAGLRCVVSNVARKLKSAGYALTRDGRGESAVFRIEKR